jgi:hypothetical protein
MMATARNRLPLGAPGGVLLVFLYALAVGLLLRPAVGTLVNRTEDKGRQ